MMKAQVVCFGEVLWDTFEDGKKPGGAPMNVALNLQKQGVNALMASSIGTDEAGDELIIYLSGNHLSCELIQRDPVYPTCIVTVKLDADQHATYTIPQSVSWDHIQPQKELYEKTAGASAIVFGSLACRDKISRATLLLLLRLPVLKIFDVNLRPPHYDLPTIEMLAAYADIIKMNEAELDLISGNLNQTKEEKMLQLQQRFRCDTICVTCGEAGALTLHENNFYEHAGFKVTVADTVGAGDAFLAAFTAGLLRKDHMGKILTNACASGAYVASKRGANPAYSAEDILNIIHKLP
ncbi:MAG: carbohydrate kinase family protein [Sphingobacteriaceae bacterium]